MTFASAQPPPPPAEPTTLAEVKEMRLREGDVVKAPLGTGTGVISLESGSLVVGVLQKFTKSKTIRVGLAVLALGLGAGLLEFKNAMDAALAVGHHVFEIPWNETALKAVDASWKFFSGGAIMIATKLYDNDPVNPPFSDGQ